MSLAAAAAVQVDTTTTTTTTSTFTFDPVFKLTVPTLDDDLTHFPPFPQLNKQMIADLSVELRKELAEIYKLKRVREKQKERQRQRDTTIRMAPTDTAATSTGNLESNLIANIVPPVKKPREELPPVLESIQSIAAVSSAVAARSLAAPRATVSSSASAHPVAVSSSSSSSFHLVSSRSAIDEVEWSQIDRDVLNELPESIRVELQTEAKRVKAAQLVTLPMLNQGNRKRSATSAGFNGTVKVLNIAAHFKKMEKRQKRAHSNSLSNANVRRDSSLTIMTDLTGASNSKPTTPILPQSPRSASSASTVTSHQRHSMPPADASASAASTTLLDDPTTAAASAVATTSTTAMVASSSIVAPLDAYSHGGDVAHPRKGFAVVDPRGNRLLYNATAIVKPLPTTATSSLDPPLVVTTNAVDLVMVDATSFASPALPIIDEGPVPMELDSQSQPMQLDVVVKEESMVKEEVKEGEREEVNQKEEVRPHIDQQIELPSDAIPFESDVVHDTSVVSDDAPTFVAFETYADIQSTLYKWIIETATPPDDSQLQLLTQYCLLQLRVHRNMELVANILQVVERIAYGCAPIQLEDKIATSAASSWRKPLQTLRSSVQTEVKVLFGGRLSSTLLHQLID